MARNQPFTAARGRGRKNYNNPLPISEKERKQRQRAMNQVREGKAISSGG
jgi:hypothetical protein